MKYKILSMGTVYLDLNCFDFPYERGFARNKEVVGKKYEAVPGGSALIFSRVCSSLKLKPVFVGKIGRDKPGALLKKILARDGVTAALIESSEVQTNIGINFIGPDESSMMASVGSANQSLSAIEVEKKVHDYLNSIEYLYFRWLQTQDHASPPQRNRRAGKEAWSENHS